MRKLSKLKTHFWGNEKRGWRRSKGSFNYREKTNGNKTRWHIDVMTKLQLIAESNQTPTNLPFQLWSRHLALTSEVCLMIENKQREFQLSLPFESVGVFGKVFTAALSAIKRSPSCKLPSNWCPRRRLSEGCNLSSDCWSSLPFICNLWKIAKLLLILLLFLCLFFR